MKLIGAYIIEARNFTDELLTISNEYMIKCERNKNQFYISVAKKNNSLEFFHSRDQSFFINAFLGINGMGKSTILEILSFSFDHKYILFFIKSDNSLYIEGFTGIEIPSFVINGKEVQSLHGRLMKQYWSIEEIEKKVDLHDIHGVNRKTVIYTNKEIPKKTHGGYYYIRRKSTSFRSIYEKLIFFNENRVILTEKLKYFENNRVSLRFDKRSEKVFPNDDSKQEEVESRVSEYLKNFDIDYSVYSNSLIHYTSGTPDNYSIFEYVLVNLVDEFFGGLYVFGKEDLIDELSGDKFLTDMRIVLKVLSYNTSGYDVEMAIDDLDALLEFTKTLSSSDIKSTTGGILIDLSDDNILYNRIKYKYDNFINMLSKLEDKDILRDYYLKDSVTFTKQEFINDIYYPFLEFNLFNGSTGEEAYTNLILELAKIVLEDKLNHISNTNNVIILFDEPDTMLHPELSRRLILDIVNLFKDLKCNYHFIFSSHSPFTISDIPTCNIVDLSKKPLELGNNNNKTFAKNIGAISIDNMILSSNIGSYAEDLIKKIINSQYTKEDKAKIMHIGDDFLRTTLERLIKHND